MEKYYEIKVLEMEQSFQCKEDEFILEAMKRARCGPIHCGCFGGGCGFCRMKIVSGSYVIEKKMSKAHVTKMEQEKGIALICCVKPRDNLIIARI